MCLKTGTVGPYSYTGRYYAASSRLINVKPNFIDNCVLSGRKFFTKSKYLYNNIRMASQTSLAPLCFYKHGSLDSLRLKFEPVSHLVA